MPFLCLCWRTNTHFSKAPLLTRCHGTGTWHRAWILPTAEGVSEMQIHNQKVIEHLHRTITSHGQPPELFFACPKCHTFDNTKCPSNCLQQNLRPLWEADDKGGRGCGKGCLPQVWNPTWGVRLCLKTAWRLPLQEIHGLPMVQEIKHLAVNLIDNIAWINGSQWINLHHNSYSNYDISYMKWMVQWNEKIYDPSPAWSLACHSTAGRPEKTGPKKQGRTV